MTSLITNEQIGKIAENMADLVRFDCDPQVASDRVFSFAEASIIGFVHAIEREFLAGYVTSRNDGARNVALEEAAKACDEICKGYEGHARRRAEDDVDFYDAYMNKALASSECSAAIRAIKSVANQNHSEAGDA